MPAPVAQVTKELEAALKKLRDAATDPEKSALIAFDYSVKDDEDFKRALEAAAIPHWFDETILSRLLATTQDMTQLMARLAVYPGVEKFKTEDGRDAWNLHETLRKALRKRLVESDRTRFVDLTERSVQVFEGFSSSDDLMCPSFDERNVKERIELVYHLLPLNLQRGQEVLNTLLASLLATKNIERLQALGRLIVDDLGEIWDLRLQLSPNGYELTSWKAACESIARSLKSLEKGKGKNGESLSSHPPMLAGEALVETLGVKSADSANKRVLIVDDNPTIRDDYRRILCPSASGVEELESIEAILFDEMRGHQAKVRPRFYIAFASQGDEAENLARAAIEQDLPFAMAIVDVRMPPGMDGVETAKRLWLAQTDLQVVLCTAYSDYSWQEIVEELGYSHRLVILKKPFDPIEVLQLSQAMCMKWTHEREATLRELELRRELLELRNSMKQSLTGDSAEQIAESLSLAADLTVQMLRK